MVKSNAIIKTGNSFGYGTMLAAKKAAIGFQSVSDDSATAMSTCRRKLLDRTLETVKRIGFTVLGDFKAFIVRVATGFTIVHCRLVVG
jgi:hypothetical protein